MRFIDAETVHRSLSVGRAAYVLREALLDGVEPDADVPRSRAEAPGGQLLLMPSASRDHAGCKVLTAAPGNPDRGLPAIQGGYLLFAGGTLTPLALIEGAALTELRTPAVSFAGVLEVVQARREPGRPLRVAVLGTGPQGVHHALGAAELFDPVEIVFVARTPREVACPVPHRVADRIPDGADLILCATSAAAPVLDSAEVADSAVVVAVGAHHPERRELPGELMARASVIVESAGPVREECGDIALAIAEGHLADGAWSTMAEVVRDRALALRLAARDRPVVFKTAGQGWEDLAVAVEVLARAGEDAGGDAPGRDR